MGLGQRTFQGGSVKKYESIQGWDRKAWKSETLSKLGQEGRRQNVFGDAIFSGDDLIISVTSLLL